MKTIKHISLNVEDEIKKILPVTLEKDLQDKLIAGIITILYEDVNGDMNLQNKNLDFQTGNMNFDFEIKRRNY